MGELISCWPNYYMLIKSGLLCGMINGNHVFAAQLSGGANLFPVSAGYAGGHFFDFLIRGGDVEL